MTVSPTRVPWSATEALQELILAEGLRPGDPMPTEIELSERLGAGRSTIREAMRTLSSLDIVEVRHGHGTYVGNFSLAPLVNGLIFRARFDASADFQTLREVLQTRIALDLAVADELVTQFGGEEDPELTRLVETMATKAQAGESFADEDRRVHLLPMARDHNRLFGQQVESSSTMRTHVPPLLAVAPGAGIIAAARAPDTMRAAARKGDAAASRQAVLDRYAPLQRAAERARLLHLAPSAAQAWCP